MRLVMAERDSFISRCDARDRQNIASELRSMTLPGASIAELQVFRTSEQLFAHVRHLKGITANDEPWDEVLERTVKECKAAIEDGNTGQFYYKMEQIRELAILINNLADYKMKSEVEHNYRVMVQLEQKIRDLEL
jgi:hypothetical protein